ncbi:MAG: murein hydrolase activator EnvC family protein [Sphingomicrobium sp.]
MHRLAAISLLCPLLVASAVAQPAGAPLDDALKAALAEQATADAETAKLEKAALQARTNADRLHAEQAAAAQAIEAAEARISTANARLALASAYVATHQQQLATERQPASSLLAGLATMAQRPPLLVLADRGGTDELVEVRLLLDSTLPVIRRRTAALSAQLAEGQRLQQASIAAHAELTRSREALVNRRRNYAQLEQKALQRALAAGGQALGASDLAIAAGESVERLRGQQANNQSIRLVASKLAGEDAAPASPFAPEGRAPRPPFAYQLPTEAPVAEGLAAVNDSGVRSRGLTLATYRGAAVTAPAAGVVKFAGPFRDYDGVLIIDHGGGWMSLIVNVGSTLRQGDRVSLGDPVGRALGPLQVELSQNGRRISPALIAGSSQNLSNAGKGG